MTIAHSVADILTEHVTLEVECIDRMYLNLYVPRLQYENGVVGFFREHRGHQFASSALMAPMTHAFVSAIENHAEIFGIPLITFGKGERKDDIAKERFARFEGEEGVVFIGKAQEKTPLLRTTKRRNPETGRSYAWLVRSTGMVNHYYFYILDRDFGPLFLKLCSYFPYNGKVCLNGHEYAKRQLAQRGIEYTALDNGIERCADPKRLQAICNALGPRQIEAVARKWLARLPSPFRRADRDAGYRYQLSILQAEFSLTQVLDRPVTGRLFFEQVIRDNLDLGRPDRVQLIFARRVTKRTPGRFRTRVLTNGVIPTLHVSYKHSDIKQYHKEGRGLRTETTINNTRDFGIGKRLKNLAALRQVGFQANRRLLSVEHVSHDCHIGEAAWTELTQPKEIDGQRASALRFDDPKVQALLNALVLLRLMPMGFRNTELRHHWAQLLGQDPSAITPGSMSYQLRRLRLRGLITRVPKTNRYCVTPVGLRTALFFTRTLSRLLRPGLSIVLPQAPPGNHRLRRDFDRLQATIDNCIRDARLAA
jgi:hypothetical protein